MWNTLRDGPETWEIQKFMRQFIGLKTKGWDQEGKGGYSTWGLGPEIIIGL